jgi:hypothetical protein
MPKKTKSEKEFKTYEEYEKEYFPNSENKDKELLENPEKFGTILAQKAIAELKQLVNS